MGDYCARRADVRRAHFHNGRKVPGLRDARHLLLHARSTFLTLFGTDAGGQTSLFAFLLPRGCERIMCHVRSSPSFQNVFRLK